MASMMIPELKASLAYHKGVVCSLMMAEAHRLCQRRFMMKYNEAVVICLCGIYDCLGGNVDLAVILEPKYSDRHDLYAMDQLRQVLGIATEKGCLITTPCSGGLSSRYGVDLEHSLIGQSCPIIGAVLPNHQ